MRGLFFKIFIIFWIAQSLIFVISTALIISRRFPTPFFLANPLFHALGAESDQAVAAYETGGCGGLESYAGTRREVIALTDAAGTDLCSSTIDKASRPHAVGGEVTGRHVGDRYLWAVPAVSRSGRDYVYLLSVPEVQEQHGWFHDLLHFAFPQLPVAIAVGGATTFVLVLIFTRPISRLRKAARELAQGNLHTRVKETPPRSALFEGDEFQGLAHDFNHMAERLESLVAAQRLLLRDVSHELRSPLARLSVALELSREDADRTMTIHLDRIQREAERLNQLIGQLLTLSSMEALEGLERFESVSLNLLLEEMLPDAEYEAQQRDATVVLRAEDECVIQGRRDLLYRAIENVVRNAIRFTEAGSEVEIWLYRSKQDSTGTAILEVSDRGPGIPESELESIFRPFYRVDQARSSHTGGFGVGLAIAERAIKLHNAELRALNRQGGGATIQMRFPLAAHSSLPKS